MTDASFSLDLSMLREITGGEPAVEQELFALFYSTFNRCTTRAAKLISTDENNEWKLVMHELKGASMNIGAHSLAGLCAEAEKIPVSDTVQRQRFYDFIINDGTQAVQFLKNVVY